MFNIFKKKSKVDILQDKYQKLLVQSHRFSTIDRKKSDEKYAEAEAVLKELMKLE